MDEKSDEMASEESAVISGCYSLCSSRISITKKVRDQSSMVQAWLIVLAADQVWAT